jgi:transposase InsO family protein
MINKNVLPIFGPKGTESLCEPCQLGKSKQLPFSASTRISTCPLDLIHTDVWSCSIKYNSGCHYYVLFIDDFSRFSWLYPLHHKSEVFVVFNKFKTLVENQFFTKIKQLQSDGGGEHLSHQFQSFLSLYGIRHRVSCSYTAQQNGLAERKHRHIMDMGLTLLAQSHLPHSFWVDAFLTSIFIINRLPTPILDHDTPFTKLFGSSPDYTFLRTFGCACFPLLRPYTSHKLMFRSKWCIFPRYSSLHNGYRCLDSFTHKVYISRHVTFDEKSFPAKEGALSPAPSSSTPAAPLPHFTFSQISYP